MPFEKAKIGLIVLAAGNSRRMRGASKQLLEFRGKSLLRRAAETALEAKFFSTTVVLGARFQDFNDEINDLPVEVLVSRSWADGLSASIKTGVSRAIEQNLDAAAIMLCDQPFVTSENLCGLRDCFVETKKTIVASKYRGTFGVPALFSCEFFAELLELNKDEGAKKIIKRHLDKVFLLDAPEAAVDVDTMRDYENLKDPQF